MQEMQSLIQKIIDLSNSSKNSPPKHLADYIKIFYSQCVDKDFADYSTEEMLNFATSSFDFFAQKPANNFKIRLQNPTIAKNGFESKCTILDIVNDDMSFLVDSVVMQFDSRGIEIRNVIHPILTTARSKDGKVESFVKENDQSNESIIQLHLAKIANDELPALENYLAEVLTTIKMAVVDWKSMVELALKSIANLQNLIQI